MNKYGRSFLIQNDRIYVFRNFEYNIMNCNGDAINIAFAF